MKAYMSTGARGFELHSAEYGHPPQALAEAKRILAETEPGGLTLTAHARGGYGSGLHGFPEGRDALAASLAEFLESGAFDKCCRSTEPDSYGWTPEFRLDDTGFVCSDCAATNT